ncbi:MAG: hydrolase [Pseudomonadota bacterium]|nr:MAG: hydrolase [Pseudomonadota bacterium]
MITGSSFQPAWWLRAPHLQTLWASLLRRRAGIATRPERLELPDSDFLDLAWMPDAAGPLVLVLHGLEGSIRSPYASGILRALHAGGFVAVLMHHRGCSGEPNRLARGYHSGETGDLAYVVQVLRRRYPGRQLFVIGYSIGGNMLLKWLGETGNDSGIEGAIAVSVPFILADAADRLCRGMSRLYQWHLLRHMKRAVRRKVQLLDTQIDVGAALASTTFWQFDDIVTAPLHGFRDVNDYYARASSRPWLKHIATPTLLLHARDDPFMFPSSLPASNELPPSVTLEITQHGGHVGFINGPWPGLAHYWLEHRIVQHLHALVGTMRP